MNEFCTRNQPAYLIQLIPNYIEEFFFLLNCYVYFFKLQAYIY